MDCIHNLYKKNYIAIDVTGFYSYFNRFYENNIENLQPHKVLYRLNCPTQEYFTYICSFFTASRENYIYNHNKNIFNNDEDRLFLSTCSPLAIAMIINKIGCISLLKFQHIIPYLPNINELKNIRQNISNYLLEN